MTHLPAFLLFALCYLPLQTLGSVPGGGEEGTVFTNTEGDTLVSLNACTAGEQYMTLEAKFVGQKKIRQETYHFDGGRAALLISRTAIGDEKGTTLTETRYFLDGNGVYATVYRELKTSSPITQEVGFEELSRVSFAESEAGLSYDAILKQSKELISAWESL